jgi:PIN domain nuclease of toxin-antitoxin system
MGDKGFVPKKTASIMEDESKKTFVSAVSIWEIVIKNALGKLRLSEAPGDWLINTIHGAGWEMLSMQATHALAVARLPAHHQDPFDRMLLAQTHCEGLSIVTPDRIFKKYRGVSVMWS